jgi:hypothetical protein
MLIISRLLNGDPVFWLKSMAWMESLERKGGDEERFPCVVRISKQMERKSEQKVKDQYRILGGVK